MALLKWVTLPTSKVNSDVETELNPLQQAVIDALGIPPEWEPLPQQVIEALENQLISALEPIAGSFTAEAPLRINKHHIATVHGCEKFHVLQRQAAFAWNINTVRGTIAHKGIELLLNWREPVIPAEIVDAAITSVAENPRESASGFLVSLTAHEMAELRGGVLGAVTNFIECFPPIKAQWRPMVEYSASYSLFDSSIIFSSRMDLVLGGPGKKVIIDVKTGRLTPTHRDDLRFYALVESLRSRQTPRQLGSYSLDSARLESENVTHELLQSAVRRTAEGTLLIADLVQKTREPQVRPGAQCRWCPINDSCELGAKYLRQLSGEEESQDN